MINPYMVLLHIFGIVLVFAAIFQHNFLLGILGVFMVALNVEI